MFQAPDLNLIVEFIFMFYKEKPIDWLLDHILWVKVCNPEKDAVRVSLCVVDGVCGSVRIVSAALPTIIIILTASSPPPTEAL